MKAFCRFPHTLLPWLIREVESPLDLVQTRQHLRTQLDDVSDEEAMETVLRFSAPASVPSDLARSCHESRLLGNGFRTFRIGGSVDRRGFALVSDRLITQYGTPRNAKEAQPMIVLGMGKLGPGELNVSSDIDLIFVFPESGETDGSRCLDNQSFFIRLGQNINVLDKTTSDGFVFRVDMRLRPYGTAGR